MIKKIIGASIGAQLAKSAPVAGGAAGTVIATALPFVLSRVALPGLAAIGAGAFAFNIYRKRRSAAQDKADRRAARSTDHAAGPAPAWKASPAGPHGERNP